MRTTNENQNQTILSITGGGKRYEVDLPALSNFLDSVQRRCDINDIDELTINLNMISDTVLDGTPDDFDAREIKHPMKLLRELTYLFNGLLHSSTADYR